MGERRKTTRVLCADLVELEWTDAYGQFRIATAVLEDISDAGACIQTETSLLEGSAIVLRFHETRAQAMVRYCRWREIGYFVGLTFSSEVRWSWETFKPQHFLNPFILEHEHNAFIV